MDFTQLEHIVAKRKLPTDDTNIKKRRTRITPSSSVPNRKPAKVNYYQVSQSELTPRVYPVKQATDSGSTNVKQDKRDVNDLPKSDLTPIPECELTELTEQFASLAPATMSKFESGFLLKRNYNLSDSLHILVGLDIDSDYEPKIYFLDKKWWMQLQLSLNCLSVLGNMRKLFDSFYKNKQPFNKVYTKHIALSSSTETNTIDITRQDRAQYWNSNTGDYAADDVKTFGVFDFDYYQIFSVPAISLSETEWMNLLSFRECILQYFKLCSLCTVPAKHLHSRYVEYLKEEFRPMLLTHVKKDTLARDKVVNDINQLLPLTFQSLTSSLLPDDTTSSDGPGNVFERLIDSEMRTFCSEKMTSDVLGLLFIEFPWMNTT